MDTANKSQAVNWAEFSASKYFWLSCSFLNSELLYILLIIFTVVTVENYLYFLSFRATMIFFFFFFALSWFPWMCFLAKSCFARHPSRNWKHWTIHNLTTFVAAVVGSLIYICLQWEKLMFGLEGGKNWCFHVPLSIKECRRSSWLFSRRSQHELGSRSCRVAQGNSGVTTGREASEEGIFAVPEQADDLSLWILPCLDAEELFREGWGDFLWVNIWFLRIAALWVVMVSPFQRKVLFGLLGGLLASDIKLAICSHLQTLFGIAG